MGISLLSPHPHKQSHTLPTPYLSPPHIWKGRVLDRMTSVLSVFFSLTYPFNFSFSWILLNSKTRKYVSHLNLKSPSPSALPLLFLPTKHPERTVVFLVLPLASLSHQCTKWLLSFWVTTSNGHFSILIWLDLVTLSKPWNSSHFTPHIWALPHSPIQALPLPSLKWEGFGGALNLAMSDVFICVSVVVRDR